MQAILNRKETIVSKEWYPASFSFLLNKVLTLVDLSSPSRISIGLNVADFCDLLFWFVPCITG
jgi:hypothetical protein